MYIIHILLSGLAVLCHSHTVVRPSCTYVIHILLLGIAIYKVIHIQLSGIAVIKVIHDCTEVVRPCCTIHNLFSCPAVL